MMIRNKILARPRARAKPALIVVSCLTALCILALLLGHRIERRADLSTLATSTNPSKIQRAMLLTCKNMNNRVLMAKQMAELSLERRLKMAKVAMTLGCIDAIEPAYQAEHFLHQPDDERQIADVIAQKGKAIEPAIHALDVGSRTVRTRALRALGALSFHLNEDQRRRILKRLHKKDPPVLVLYLRTSMGQPINLNQIVTHAEPTKLVVPKPTPKPTPKLAPSSEPSFELGKDKLRLNVNIESPQPLSLPSLGSSLKTPKGGVLFKANEAR